jgi:hypothetical protein
MGIAKAGADTNVVANMATAIAAATPPLIVVFMSISLGFSLSQ